MKNPKYRYIKVIQGNYGMGWEDESEYETDSQGYMIPTERNILHRDLTEYKIAAANNNGQIRVVRRRERL